MNLFWKKLFGGLTATDKLEQAELDLLMAYKRYCDVEVSEQLAEYTQLFHIIKAADFIEKKKTLQNRKYKDTEEYRDFKKLEKLNNDANLKLYFEVLDSSELKDFLAFKETEDYEKLGDPKLVKADEKLQKYKKFEKSKAYKVYVRFHESYVITEFEDLKKICADEKFIEANEFWKNKDRWKTTEEYKTEQRYYELQSTPDIKFYSETDPKSFVDIDKWLLTFEDKFEGDSVNAEVWANGYYNRAESLKKLYSFANEKQANTDGANIQVNGGNLRVITKPEKVKAVAWNATSGFTMKEFDYTSGIINTGSSFQQANGLIKAKLRINGSTDISHACWLGTDGKLPHINIFCYNGKNITVNNFIADGKEVAMDKEVISGISPTDFYIYSLEWTPTELIWSVNNVEVFRVNKNVPNKSMFLSLNSFISENQKGGSGALEVDWIKVYTLK